MSAPCVAPAPGCSAMRRCTLDAPLPGLLSCSAGLGLNSALGMLPGEGTWEEGCSRASCVVQCRWEMLVSSVQHRDGPVDASKAVAAWSAVSMVCSLQCHQWSAVSLVCSGRPCPTAVMSWFGLAPAVPAVARLPGHSAAACLHSAHTCAAAQPCMHTERQTGQSKPS